ncbi:MAG: filamentous hemagglutinin N-terminal domain-containing protein [Pleurocapsa sp.]
MNLKFWHLWRGIALAIAFNNAVQAQVVEDNTLSTEVSNENNRDFTVNAGEQKGDNLFHSFREFSIPNNGSVLFNNALTIQNIITRVTGASVSNINGLIQSNGTANLFLLNPNGIIFGEGARLDIGGSFIGTTAESLVFQDATFSTKPNSELLLSVNVPLGLQFGSNPGEIVNRANLSIANPADPTGQTQIKRGLTTAPGQTLALLGGNITLDGGAVTAPGGSIELGSVGENSLVTLDFTAGWQADYSNVSQFRNLVLDNLASIDTSGVGGGSINVYGRRVEVLNGSAITANTFGEIDGRNITIEATETVELRGSDRNLQNLDLGFAGLDIFVPLSSQITTNTFGQGDGGNIEIKTAQLSVLDGAKIQAQTTALPNNNPRQQLGRGGDILINADASVELRGSKPLLGITDNAPELFQNLFPIAPEAKDFVSFDRAVIVAQASSIDAISSNTGSSGDIKIATNQLQLGDASSISNSPAPFTSSDGGEIKIDALESIEILGSSEPGSPLVSLITANTFGVGNAGNIELSTDKLLLSNGGGITTGTLGSGRGGNIILNAREINVSGTSGDGVLRSGFGSETFGVGDAGDLTVNAQSLNVTNQGQITVRGLSLGSPGNLTINAENVNLNNGRITAENAAALTGGNIQLQIQNELTLQQNSLISAQAFSNANGGNINIDAGFIIAFPQQNNDILANAVTGNGGNIRVKAQGIFGLQQRSPSTNITNDFDASSQFGTEGIVAIAFPNFTATDGLFNLPADFLDINYLFKNNFCQVSRNSKFIVTGRGGIPLVPQQDLLSEHTWSDWRIVEEVDGVENEAAESAQGVEVKKIALIQGWVTDAEGKVVLTAKPLAVTPRQPELNTPGCN